MRTFPSSLFVVLLTFAMFGAPQTTASPVNPQAHKTAFEAAKKDAEAVVDVRVLSVVCTQSDKEGDKVRAVTLQLALQVTGVEKGPLAKNQIVVVSHHVDFPWGPGPGAYGYMATLHRFPFDAGGVGSVALRWDEKARAWQGIAGWVPTPGSGVIPTEVGQAACAKDAK